MTAKGIYVLSIQENALSKQDTTHLKKLLMDYVNKTKLPPLMAADANYTLSNCTDRETDCTCDKDD